MYGIAKTNWDAFCGPDIVDLCGHLMIYPMLVNQDGRCDLLQGPYQSALSVAVDVASAAAATAEMHEA